MGPDWGCQHISSPETVSRAYLSTRLLHVLSKVAADRREQRSAHPRAFGRECACCCSGVDGADDTMRQIKPGGGQHEGNVLSRAAR